MKKKTKLVILAFVLLGGLFRFGCMALHSVGGTRGLESPDKRFLACASDRHDAKFWGGKHNYYEFTIQTTGGQRIQYVLMDEPPQGMISTRDDDLLIQWAADSSTVTYSFKGTRLTLSVKP